MIHRVARLFVIKTRFEAYAVIYALAVGGVERGIHYFDQFPGWGGYLLFLACTGSVFMAGAKILDSVPRRDRPTTAPRRRRSDEQRQDRGRDRRGQDRRANDRRQTDRREGNAAYVGRERPA
jgi:hypothetical protein